MNPLKHVAIIMDGNGRWGLKKYNSRKKGHRAGLNTVEKIIKSCLKENISYLTLFAFSTENWRRPESEINYLFELLENFLKLKIKKFNKNNIKLKILGKKKFSKNLNKLLNNSEKITKQNSKLQINLALNYGSKGEIVYAVNLLKNKKYKITESDISSKLFTKNIPDPDLLIRTGNTNRLSNFLLWQISYTEIFFIRKLWPDFNEIDFYKIIKKFKKIKRNFGEVK